MDTETTIALASFIGAIACYASGYLTSSLRSARRAQLAERLQRQSADASGAIELPGAIRLARDGEQPAPCLQHLAEEHAAASAAIYDDQGLLVQQAGQAVDERIGALLGLLARSLNAAEACCLGRSEIVELRLDLGHIRCRRVVAAGQPMMLATLAKTTPSPPTQLENAVIAAIPTLVAA